MLKNILLNDLSSIKLMSPYILLGVSMTILFIIIQFFINTKGDNKEKNEKKK